MYNLDKFLNKCDELYNLSEDNKEYKDAILKVAAKILYDAGDEPLATDVNGMISNECKILCEKD